MVVVLFGVVIVVCVIIVLVVELVMVIVVTPAVWLFKTVIATLPAMQVATKRTSQIRNLFG